MSSMVPAFHAVFPLLAFMLLGFFLGKIKLLNEETAAGINRLMFRLCLPLGVFQSVYSADIRREFDLKLALFVAFSSVISYILIAAFIGRREKDRTVAPVMIQGIHKSNYNLLGIPIVASFFGSEIGMAAVLVIVITPIGNTCATIAFESARREDVRSRSGSGGVPAMLGKILLNPLVFSSLLGLAANFSGVRIPAYIMDSVVSPLSAMALPAAMIALGSGFDFRSIKKWAGRLVVVCLGKLIFMPLILVPAAALLGVRGANLIAVLVFSGAPTAVNSYSTAVSMGGNEELAGEIVAVTSLLSVFTLFVFLTVLGGLSLL